jgi:copper chaperone CopZ
MKKILVLPMVICGLLTACSSSPETPAVSAIPDVPRTVSEVTVSGTPVTMADLSISGMTCEMMCGGSIKKALAKLPGVTSTEIRFTEGDATDHAIVTFDAAQVSDAEIVKTVQAIHDGQYKVSAVAITKQVQGETTDDAPEEAAEANEAQVSASLPELVMPSLFGFLARMLRL